MLLFPTWFLKEQSHPCPQDISFYLYIQLLGNPKYPAREGVICFRTQSRSRCGRFHLGGVRRSFTLIGSDNPKPKHAMYQGGEALRASARCDSLPRTLPPSLPGEYTTLKTCSRSINCHMRVPCYNLHKKLCTNCHKLCASVTLSKANGLTLLSRVPKWEFCV